MTVDAELLLVGEKSKRLNQALKLAGKTKAELEQDINILKTWINSQPHFPEIPSHGFLTNFVILNKFSIEKCKKHLDMYYSLRSVLPELFVDKHFREPCMVLTSKVMTYVPLPRLTKEGYRVTLIKFMNRNSNEFDLYDAMAYVQNFLEISLVADIMMGEIIIVDLTHFTFSHVTQITPIQVKKMFMSAEKIYKNIVKQLHYINVASYVESLISMVKQLVSKKLSERIYAHQSADKLESFFSKDILPIEYGGSEFTHEELKRKWEDMAEKYDQRLLQLENLRTDESKRPTPLINDELLGFYGNFKRLNVD